MKHYPRRFGGHSAANPHRSSSLSSAGAGCSYCGGSHIVTSKRHCAAVFIACWGACMAFVVAEVALWLLGWIG